ncbi:MAG: carbon-phosphorus lyase complex subunit PhnI [Turicibacter sp.]|nr:carbon-phosphorus lyase complex subunit PhnI [Turicibacter sp.]
MGYVAVKGGTQAIEASIERLKFERLKGQEVLDVEAIKSGMRGLIDQVMSEASLYDVGLAAIAIKQAEGSAEEAVFLLRAFRSTLPRKHVTRVADSATAEVERRISASFKDVPGGQILGASTDYTQRLIDFGLLSETKADALNFLSNYRSEDSTSTDLGALPKVVDYLREEGLLVLFEDDDQEPDDVTKMNLEFPTSRSTRLQMLTRGQTGAVISLGYSALRTYGAAHPTVGELRIANIPLYIHHPLFEACDEGEDYYIGDIKVTEVESFITTEQKNQLGKTDIQFSIGYGVAFGQNETKAIAMSILDKALQMKDSPLPVSNEEFVLYSIDTVESTGFISHLKLPHYVTFQSKLDSARKKV